MLDKQDIKAMEEILGDTEETNQQLLVLWRNTYDRLSQELSWTRWHIKKLEKRQRELILKKSQDLTEGEKT